MCAARSSQASRPWPPTAFSLGRIAVDDGDTHPIPPLFSAKGASATLLIAQGEYCNSGSCFYLGVASIRCPGQVPACGTSISSEALTEDLMSAPSGGPLRFGTACLAHNTLLSNR